MPAKNCFACISVNGCWYGREHFLLFRYAFDYVSMFAFLMFFHTLSSAHVCCYILMSLAHSALLAFLNLTCPDAKDFALTIMQWMESAVLGENSQAAYISTPLDPCKYARPLALCRVPPRPGTSCAYCVCEPTHATCISTADLLLCLLCECACRSADEISRLKRRKAGRALKLKGDLCLLSCSPRDATN
jgi:hypothetical protein